VRIEDSLRGPIESQLKGSTVRIEGVYIEAELTHSGRDATSDCN
jgi:hypothetical protein